METVFDRMSISEGVSKNSESFGMGFWNKVIKSRSERVDFFPAVGGLHFFKFLFLKAYDFASFHK